MRRWDQASQSEYKASRRDLPGGPSAQVRVLSPNGQLVALAEGNKVHVFDTSTGKETFQIDSASTRVRHLIFSRDEGRLVIVDDKIRWLSAKSGEVIASVDQKFNNLYSLALSADGLTLAVVGHGLSFLHFSIFRLDATTRTVTLGAKDVRASASLKVAALTPDGQRIALGYVLNAGSSVYDTATGRLLAENRSAHASPIAGIAFSGDAARLATADSEGTIKIWADTQKLTSNSAVLLTLKGHQRGDRYRQFLQRWQAAGQYQHGQNGQSLGSGNCRCGNSASGTFRPVLGSTLFPQWASDRHRRRQQRTSVGCRHGPTRAGIVGR